MPDDPRIARIRTLVVDDEPLARRTIVRLTRQDDEFEVVGECSGSEAPARIRELRPDLVFLDVQMPGMDGFAVLQALRGEPLPLVVFVTAYDEYAVRAFEERALDYLLKPFSDRRLFEALRRTREIVRRRETEIAQHRLLGLLASRMDGPNGEGASPRRDPPSEGATAPDRLVLRDGGRTLVFSTAEITWIEASGSCAVVHGDRGDELVRSPLGAVEELLDGDRFFRVHRSAVVNLDRILELSHLSHGDYVLVLRDGTELKLSRSRREEFELRLGLSP